MFCYGCGWSNFSNTEPLSTYRYEALNGRAVDICFQCEILYFKNKKCSDCFCYLNFPFNGRTRRYILGKSSCQCRIDKIKRLISELEMREDLEELQNYLEIRLRKILKSSKI